ncbi:MAG: putative transcriptional regulator, XRE family [Leptospirillum rubarum]|nr:MAG: putative transcriptional regulator, XRE family [Leptospirillum rubarum]
MNSNIPEIWNDLDDKEYRDASVSANIFSWIAYQIRELREQRGLTQTDLANLLGKRQSVVSRLESSGEKGLSLKTLLELASALDTALVLKFVPFSRFLREYEDVSPEAMKVESYIVDKALNAHHPRMWTGPFPQPTPLQFPKGIDVVLDNNPAKAGYVSSPQIPY